MFWHLGPKVPTLEALPVGLWKLENDLTCVPDDFGSTIDQLFTEGGGTKPQGTTPARASSLNVSLEEKKK